MIGARDMAFPRLNALSFWLFVGSGCLIYAGLFLGDGPNAGWFDYVPLALRQYDPGPGVDFYALGLIFNGLSSTAAATNFIVTIFKLRAPGMSLNRMPLFCFANLAASLALVFALPPLTVDLVFLELAAQARLPLLRRRPRRAAAALAEPLLDLRASRGLHHRPARVRDRHLDHPDLRAAPHARLPARRARRAARRVHRLRRLGAPHVRDRAPDDDARLLRRRLDDGRDSLDDPDLRLDADGRRAARPIFKAPLLFIGGFIVFFVIGGLSGIMFAAIPFDQAATDTYFVVAHLHFVIFGAAVFPLLGGLYYWFPKVTGRMYHERWAVASFWVTAVGTFTDVLPDAHRRPARDDAPRLHLRGGSRLGDLQPDRDGRRLRARRRHPADRRRTCSGARAAARRCGPDPFFGGTLEWTIPSPPPHYNFAVIPTVTSAYPNWDRGDREADERRLDRDEPSLPGGHLTPVLDACATGFPTRCSRCPPSRPGRSSSRSA